MKHFILLIALTFPQIIDAAPRSIVISDEQIAQLQAAAAAQAQSASEDAKHDKKRDLILSALGAVISATNMAISRKDEDRTTVRQEAKNMLNNIYNFISVITKRGSEMDPEIKELVTELLTVCERLKRSLNISGRNRQSLAHS